MLALSDKLVRMSFVEVPRHFVLGASAQVVANRFGVFKADTELPLVVVLGLPFDSCGIEDEGDGGVVG